MKLNTGMSVAGILDDTHQPLVRTLADRNSLANRPITSTNPDWRWHRSTAINLALQLRIHAGKIRSALLGIGRTGTLGDNRSNVGGAGNKNTGILRNLAVVQEHKGAVNVQNRTTAGISIHFLDSVTDTDLGTVAVCCHCVATLDLVGNLRVQNSASLAFLREDIERSLLNADNTRNSRLTKTLLVPYNKQRSWIHTQAEPNREDHIYSNWARQPPSLPANLVKRR